MIDHLHCAENTSQYKGCSALHLVAFKGHATTVQMLVKSGADTSAKEEYGQMALHWGAMEGHTGEVHV